MLWGDPSREGLTVMTWIMTAVAILLTFGRYLVRFRTLGRFWWDDAAHALAVATMIAVVSLFTVFFPQIYLIDEFARGKGRKLSASEYRAYLRFQVAVSVCWWISLYAVKLSFLLLYRMLFVVSTTLRTVWWTITMFTMVTFWVCIAGELTVCGTSKNLLKEAHCESKTGLKDYITVIEYSGVVHVLSDLIIMAFPLYVVKGLQMRLSQKMGLASIFCLAILVVIFDILRTVFSAKSARGGAVGASTALWDILEITIAVIVSCLPTYRSIVTQRKRRKQQKINGTYANITGQDQRLVKTQPSLELADVERATENDQAKMKRVVAGHNADIYSTHTVAFADEEGLQPPEPALIGFKQEFSVIGETR